MRHFSLRRSIAGGILGVFLLSGSLTFAYDADQYDSYNHDRSYDPQSMDQSQDSYRSPSSPDGREVLPSPPPLVIAQASQGNNTPFGMSKSTAGAIAGALLGAGSGAIIGSHKGKAGQGAAIGAGLGAVGGYMVGHQIESQDQSLDEQDRAIEQQRQELARNREIIEELKRQKLEARETNRGVVVNLPEVLFEFNSNRLTPAARDKVSHIADVLNTKTGERRVSIEGHTDAIGSESYNLALSERRAQAVAQELSFDGVRQARLTTHGFGKKYPVAPNTQANGADNPSGRAKNRRVEVVIEN